LVLVGCSEDMEVDEFRNITTNEEGLYLFITPIITQRTNTSLQMLIKTILETITHTNNILLFYGYFGI